MENVVLQSNVAGGDSSRVLDGDDIISSGDSEQSVRETLKYKRKHPSCQPVAMIALIN